MVVLGVRWPPFYKTNSPGDRGGKMAGGKNKVCENWALDKP